MLATVGRVSTSPTSELIAFNKAIHGVYTRAKTEVGYNATIFLRMLQDRGPLETARFLIHTPKPSDGFTALWQKGRLDLAVENQVLDGRFHDLFTDDEREICRERLRQYGFDAKT